MSADPIPESLTALPESDRGRVERVETVAIDGREVPRLVGEYWAATQRQSHSLHEVSYRACFKAELPRFFIERWSQPGDVVYDPFMGRGTTLLEAALHGRVPLGNDVNPLAGILLRPRLDPPGLREVQARLAEIEWDRAVEVELDLSMFYHPETLAEIAALRAHLLGREREGRLDAADRWIRMVATNRLTGHSPGFFSVYTMPPNQAVTAEAQAKINERRGQRPADAYKDVRALILRKSRALLRDLTPADRAWLAEVAPRARVLCGDARETREIADGSVALVVTSPPFLNVVQYAKDNWLRCWFNGIDAQAVAAGITSPRSLEEWSGAMLGALRELRRVVRPGGWIAFEVGDVDGGRLLLDEVIAPLGEEAGLVCEAILVNEQEFTKTANCWGVRNNRKGTNTNRIVLLTRQ
ncbi:MAG: site-specific DNA-methyltransferase [Armatimonadetes bacterium]|jgi:DNA modification methylase|nr:site-specific DNA-methyltransferase [Armatimonadota bacterium]